MPSSRMRAAIAWKLLPCSSSKCSLPATRRCRIGLASSGPAESSVTSKAPRSWHSSICAISWLVACWWKSAER